MATWNDREVHNAHVVTYESGPHAGRQIAFTCIVAPEPDTLDVIDVTDKSNILVLDRATYPNSAYAHQCWLSEDRQYLYFGDERDEFAGLPTTTYVFDVRDLDNVFLATSFTNGNSAIDHNRYVRGNLLFESNLTSGLRVWDISEPLAPIEVAWFDSHPDDDSTNFAEMSSNYPFFPSGTVIGIDGRAGLLVFSVNVLSGRASNYCMTSPNSVGPGALISWTGTTSIFDNVFVVTASGLPPNEFALFFYGPEQFRLPYGNGFLCVAPGALGLFRLNPPTTASGAGFVSRSVDFGNPPETGGTVVSGSTWNFQNWYRDPAAGGAFVNFSDALSVTFSP